MLTREIALARLRATGTLSSGAPSANALTRAQVNSTQAKAAAQAMRDNKGRGGKRFLAPSAFHVVLP